MQGRNIGHWNGVRRCALLLLCFALGCYRFDRVPAGVKQSPLDLWVGTLQQRYTVLEPAPMLPPSGVVPPGPGVLLLHSGFSGDEGVTADLGRTLAGRGMTVILPAYRGQLRKFDGKRSDGQVEFCDGEVDDAQAALDWLRTQPSVDPARIAVMGASHGGCISLRLAARNPQVRALVSMSAPVAAGPLVRHLQEQAAGTFFYNGILGAQIRGYVKGGPADLPQSYTERSPLYTAHLLKMPMLVIHGQNDTIVPTQQACWLVQALRQNGRPAHERWIHTDGTIHEAVAPLCPVEPAPSPTAAQQTQAPPDGPAAALPPPAPPTGIRTELVLLRDQNHIYSAQTRQAAHQLALEFIQQELVPKRPPH